jgi:uncharacterized protein YndB with AHSA1/START domain
MAIRFEHAESIRRSPEDVFTAMDDLPLTSKWLPPCISLAKVGSGQNAVGDKLRYVYKQGRGRGEMDGEIIDRVPGKRLYCVYNDAAFTVGVDLRVAPAAEGAITTHVIEITPKSFVGRIMTPLIKMGLGKQTRTAAGNLKRILEERHS